MTSVEATGAQRQQINRSDRHPLIRRAERWMVVKWLSLPASFAVAAERLTVGDNRGAFATVALGASVFGYANGEESAARRRFVDTRREAQQTKQVDAQVPETIGEYFMPPGFQEDPNVKFRVGLAALAAELASEHPDEDRVEALRLYVEKFGHAATEAVQRHEEAVLESKYPEDEE
ncbi:MAG: hypothetical protein U0520_03960 [Candidatus Saccharimonadales bacterium]